MKVIRASVLGFCPGVRRAVALAEKAATEAAATGRPVFILGQIVHNPSVSARLADLGAVQIDENTVVPAGSLVVIRSHGVTPEIIRKLKTAGADIVDATCPKVLANQRAAAHYAADGFTVVVAGDKGHGETASVAGNAPGAVIVSSPAEAATIAIDGPVALIAQTTMSEAEYDAIRDALKETMRRGDGAGVDDPGLPAMLVDVRGICSATRERRCALEELCKRVDAVVVVGGMNSANTRRLAELARSLGVPALHVESEAGIPATLAVYRTVGLTAGASTPDADIDEAETRLSEISSISTL
jgi:4-hydroxy-3-methylbut-2-enyl diphosphate reductase